MRAIGWICGVFLLGCAGLEEMIPPDLIPPDLLDQIAGEGEDGPEDDPEDGEGPGSEVSEEEAQEVRDKLRQAGIKLGDLHESCTPMYEGMPPETPLPRWLAKMRGDAEEASFRCEHVESDPEVLVCKAHFQTNTGENEWMINVEFETDEERVPIGETVRCVGAG